MEIRKIQVTGGSTHVVSLPKKWVDRNGLGRSDTVAIHEEPDDSLLIVPHQGQTTETRRRLATLAETDSRDDAVRRVVGAYLAGADEIVVRFPRGAEPPLRDAVRSITRELIGVEILDETEDTMTLQDLVGVSDMNLRKTITRMHRIARIMFDDALRALQGQDPRLATDVSARDDEVDRLLWMVSKQMHALLEQPRLAARLDAQPAAALNFYLVARTLERMADHASKMSKNIRDGVKLSDDLLADFTATGEAAGTLWDEAISALKNEDFSKASAVADKGRSMATWRGELSVKHKGTDQENQSRLTLIADSIDRIRGYSLDIAEVAMNQTFLAQSPE